MRRKADCTPEVWVEQLTKDRERKKRPHNIARAKAHAKTEEVKARRRAYDRERRATNPDRQQQERTRYDTPEAKAKRREYRKRYYSDPVKKARLKDTNLRAMYGVGLGQLNCMRVAQGNACAVCRAPFDDASKFSKPHVDHCHKTGIVRGLLCSTCNVIEGLARRTGLTPTEFAERLQAYLDNPPAQEETLW